VNELLGPAEVRDLATRLGVRPTKTLGQNFVHDANTIRRIVRLADVDETTVALEVGPGLGSLTLGLLPRVRELHAVEIDPVLARALPATVAAHTSPAVAARLRIHHRDALEVRAVELDPHPSVLVANLPYNTGVPILLHLLAELDLARAVVMVQREVADRLVAEPGSRIYGVPSVKLRWFGRAEVAGRVPATVFWPVPHVESALVAFRAQPVEHGITRGAVFQVVDAAFAQRRKMLRSALAPWAGSGSVAAEVLERAAVAPTARGEQLSLAAFVEIARVGAAMGLAGIVGA
jgi:16S rRNA (adenine1518-N6/adenine1519-N6)-dimethyltransferase